MNVNSNLPQYMAHWFTEPVIKPGHTGGFATVKPEYMDEVRRVYKERLTIAKAEEAKRPLRPMKAELTDEQKSYLSKTYNRNNMSVEEYKAFAEDLHTFGILNEKDLEDLQLRGSGFVPWRRSLAALGFRLFSRLKIIACSVPSVEEMCSIGPGIGHPFSTTMKKPEPILMTGSVACSTGFTVSWNKCDNKISIGKGVVPSGPLPFHMML